MEYHTGPLETSTPFREQIYNNILVNGEDVEDTSTYDSIWELLQLPVHFKGNCCLVEMYQTYWNAFEKTEDFLFYLYGLDPKIVDYFIESNEKKVGLKEKHEKYFFDRLLDQNHMMSVTVDDNKDHLLILGPNEDVLGILNDNRIKYQATLLTKK